eukprot:CAMPEP_0172577066 /NCGR_PEP_ID=MMETSP1067-20121228/138043_1 /TAXON_ID=265564 ORGANISM="Thalassiosira punctigera, Strain Tpunct2005C2" /NCGR_SAMPLE_ID=MMETSP1067 /ASSEMBLY_ACC=CAM_ASM_000444 /LENGTH=450 /DNA_ID=CAMNT_0013369749 /DNA_START=175 /DNA_END=1527 /DNA_ORIENTATION=-
MKTAPNLKDEVMIPSVSFSLAAVVRRRQSQSQKHPQQPQQYALVHEKKHPQQPQQYTLVHERPPRGWWLPGGGIEHRDDTPVHAAIRETVEEAGSPSLLPLLPLSRSARMTKEEEPKLRLLPSMTHLISLQQSPGRIRFIFRGEWIDEFGDGCDGRTTESDESRSILKCHPGDEESIEAKWLTWDDIQCFEQRKRGKRKQSQSAEKEMPAASVECMADPWLRGHEPLEFYGLLERSWQENESVPGLPVHMVNFSGEHHEQQGEEVTGAFFGRMESGSDQSGRPSGLTLHGRAALLVHLQCRLIVYDSVQQRFAVDIATKKFPSSYVKNQNNVTLAKLAKTMMKDLVSFPSKDVREHHVRLLRIEHNVHANGREATLTVFPSVRHSSAKGVHLSEIANETMSWVSADDVTDSLERKLAMAALSDQRESDNISSLKILRDGEGSTESIMFAA